ncbi:unnamed protein product [Peronospora belbahrii]|uniref:RRM domain-containing protein n=1 Tax=Peronospora belbahrii TaxID=622444 RepID=A0AAU9KRX6_9STRA|nr:unnamed protein product [Peronospora belbahrii]CAH0521453.1 unnamed protein product [Peronospora belbahrii]
MAQNLSFARGGTSSWADEDDVELQPLPVIPKITSMETPEPIVEEETKPEEQYQDEPRHGDQGDFHREERNDRQEGYGDRRGRQGGHRSGHDDRRGSREERPKNPVPDVGPWKLFVGNLPFRLTEDDLAEFIGPDGIRDIRFPRDYEHRPKGFAYVEFDDKEKLVQALALDGCNVDGRPVKMDVALSHERERKPRNNSRFEKRNDRSSQDRSREGSDARQERPRLSLLPRTATEKNDSDAIMPSIFGEAKPRDESAYLERKKALELERKAKAKESKAKESKAKEVKAKEGKEFKAKAKTEAQAAVFTHRSNRDDSSRGGRGRSRGHSDRRHVDGGHGRGVSMKEDASARKSEPRPKLESRSKRLEPPKAKISALASAKMANVFEVLDDSDSSSD